MSTQRSGDTVPDDTPALVCLAAEAADGRLMCVEERDVDVSVTPRGVETVIGTAAWIEVDDDCAWPLEGCR